MLASMDAHVWAQEFIKYKEENNWSLEDINEPLMITWFANAIETTRDMTDLDDIDITVDETTTIEGNVNWQEHGF